jgi:hypothetical protein
MDKVPKQKIMSVDFCCALFSILDFYTLEDVINMLFRNIGEELPLYAAQHPRTAQISHDDMVTQGLVWLCMVRFSASCANFR